MPVCCHPPFVFNNPILENVKLDVLKVRRRQAKMILPLIADLVVKHAKTLKTVGRLGLTEAARGLTKEVNHFPSLLMTFYLLA